MNGSRRKGTWAIAFILCAFLFVDLNKAEFGPPQVGAPPVTTPVDVTQAPASTVPRTFSPTGAGNLGTQQTPAAQNLGSPDIGQTGTPSP
jgi:hypothetical protein